jgi:predicted dehydrogenase
MPLGFAIVGCGMIAGFHARALAEIAEAQLVALVSRHKERARSLADSLAAPCNVYSSIEPALIRSDIDAVIVATPSGAHMEPAIAAALARKHVVVEKPLEITLERCDRIIEACDRSGVQLCTIFQARFSELNQELKAAVEGARFGRVTLAETTCKWWRPQSYYDEGGWKGTKALDGGGALMNQAIHNVDLLAWLMGPVTEVSGYTATLAHQRIEVEDTAVACLRFANGALGVVQAATGAHPGLPTTIAIHGDRGSVVVENDAVVRWQLTPETAHDRDVQERFARPAGSASGANNPAGISHLGHVRQLTDFVRAVQTGQKPLVDGRAARQAVQIILGIYKSAASGRREKL